MVAVALAGVVVTALGSDRAELPGSDVRLPDADDLPDRGADTGSGPVAATVHDDPPPPQVGCPHAPEDCVAWIHHHPGGAVEHHPVVVVSERELVVTLADRLLALDLADGRRRWAAPVAPIPEGDGYTELLALPAHDLLLLFHEGQALDAFRLGTGAPLWRLEQVGDRVGGMWSNGSALRLLLVDDRPPYEQAGSRLISVDPATGRSCRHSPVCLPAAGPVHVTDAAGDELGEAVLVDGTLLYREHGPGGAGWEVDVADEHDWFWVWLGDGTVELGSSVSYQRTFDRRDGTELPTTTDALGDALADAHGPTPLFHDEVDDRVVDVWVTDEDERRGRVEVRRDGEVRFETVLPGELWDCCVVLGDTLVAASQADGHVVVHLVDLESGVARVVDLPGYEAYLETWPGDEALVVVHDSVLTSAVRVPDGSIAWQSDRDVWIIDAPAGMLEWPGGFLRLVPPPAEVGARASGSPVG